MSVQAESPSRQELETASVVPLRHPWRWVSAAIITLLVVMIAYTLVANERFEWPTVARYLFSRPIIDGLLLTIQLTVIATVASLILGTMLALMRTSANPILRLSAAAYIWIFRSVPLLVQLILFYNISALFPTINIGLPFGIGPQFAFGEVNAIITPMVAAILAFSLNESAYTAETVRGGLLSVDKGQIEAGRAMGFSEGKIVWLVVLPQALRVFIPPFGNQVVNLLKMTSLVSVIALADLLYSAQIIYSRTFETIPLLIVASIWYLILVSAMSYGQSLLEARFAQRGNRVGKATKRSGPTTDTSRFFALKTGAVQVQATSEKDER
ncbi:amino acid ABC transporter membrane protein, PAAT family [Agrococcus baldri]|uniref:Amino acid ABC transporter membrane protein, PAAT family n=1 Tax=Agrococcus baldri TaxID=153730 RepID=A0AA94KZV4_9MICO|nr:amino acid ABC transporter permease [Agrococcus baldri]SFS11812.1 amino acid ABC transporter membrane protein, PAAT family [Agrococcus baldri]